MVSFPCLDDSTFGFDIAPLSRVKELASERPDVDFVSVDIAPVAPHTPNANIEFEVYNVLEGIRAADESFDVVYCRATMTMVRTRFTTAFPPDLIDHSILQMDMYHFTCSSQPGRLFESFLLTFPICSSETIEPFFQKFAACSAPEDYSFSASMSLKYSMHPTRSSYDRRPMHLVSHASRGSSGVNTNARESLFVLQPRCQHGSRHWEGFIRRYATCARFPTDRGTPMH